MISDGIVKVDSFLNHRLETGLLFDMGAELARRFSKDKPDLVLTVEASGIALAMTTAHALGDIPVVFAKKGIAANQSPDMAEEKVYSFTHQCESLIRLESTEDLNAQLDALSAELAVVLKAIQTVLDNQA